MENNLSITVTDTNTFGCAKVRLGNDHKASVQDVEENDFLKKGVAPNIAEFVQHWATDPYCKQAALSVGQAKVEFTIDRNGLILRVTSINGAVQVLVPHQFGIVSCTTHAGL